MRLYVMYLKDPDAFYVDAYDGEGELADAIRAGTYRHVNITISKEVEDETYGLLAIHCGDDRLHVRRN